MGQEFTKCHSQYFLEHNENDGKGLSPAALWIAERGSDDRAEVAF